MHRFIDLFAGIGGFHVALQKKGMKCVFASEIDKEAASAYEANFGIVPKGDICHVKNEDIPEHDVLCAGFPCQPFSISGKRAGFTDERGRLFYEIVRIAKYHRPMLMLLENVKTILTLDNGKVQREIYKKIAEIGYKLEHVVLNAGDFGIPQRRIRAYFVAIRNDCPLHFLSLFSFSSFRQKILQDIVLPDIETDDLVIKRDDIVIEKPEKQKFMSKPIKIGYLNKGGQGERIYSTSGHAITLSANGGGVGHRTGLYLVNNRVRRLHIDEAKLVMGFKKDHKVGKGNDGYKQLGNAVIPEMIKCVCDNVRGL